MSVGFFLGGLVYKRGFFCLVQRKLKSSPYLSRTTRDFRQLLYSLHSHFRTRSSEQKNADKKLNSTFLFVIFNNNNNKNYKYNDNNNKGNIYLSFAPGRSSAMG